MPKSNVSDMRTSLEDARFFYQKLGAIIRGPEQQQNLERVRRYFRAYLHCWKCILHFVREVKGLAGKKNEQAWISWCKKWRQSLDPNDSEVFDCLRVTRDHDTHVGMIKIDGEVAAGLFPIVMFQPGKGSGPPRELISCRDRGLIVADHLIREHTNV